MRENSWTDTRASLVYFSSLYHLTLFLLLLLLFSHLLWKRETMQMFPLLLFSWSSWKWQVYSLTGFTRKTWSDSKGWASWMTREAGGRTAGGQQPQIQREGGERTRHSRRTRDKIRKWEKQMKLFVSVSTTTRDRFFIIQFRGNVTGSLVRSTRTKPSKTIENSRRWRINTVVRNTRLRRLFCIMLSDRESGVKVRKEGIHRHRMRGNNK